MGVSAAIVAIGAGAYQSYGQHQAGVEQKKIANYNAKVADIQAKDAIDRGNNDALKQRVMARRVRGGQRAALAGQGIDVNAGTATELQNETTTLGELDAITIKNNAAREAWGYQVSAKGRRMQGRIDMRQADRESNATLLTTASSGYRMAYGSA